MFLVARGALFFGRALVNLGLQAARQARINATMAAYDALEADQEGADVLSAWQAFLARAEAHEVVRAA